MSDSRLSVLLISNMYPSAATPKFGVFVADAELAMIAEGINVRRVVNSDPRSGAMRLVRKYTELLAKVILEVFRPRADVIHAHYLFPTGAFALIPAWSRRSPLILFSHGSDVLLADRRWPIGALTRTAVRHAQRVVVPSEGHARIVCDTFGLSRERVDVIPSGVDAEYFSPGDRGESRRYLDFANDERYLLFMGALDDNKGEGCTDVVRAIADPLLGDVRLIIVGEGPYREQLDKLVDDLGVRDRVSFRGSVDREGVVQLLRAADVLVVPSRRESLGLVALEARAVGTPVVSTGVGGLPEHIEQGKSGEIYSPGDIQGLVEALERVLQGRLSGLYHGPFDMDGRTLQDAGRALSGLTASVVEEWGDNT